MRIISKQRDYYDSAMSYGIDRELQFIRTPTVVSHHHSFRRGTTWTVEEGTISKTFKSAISRAFTEFSLIPTEIRGIEAYADRLLIGFCGRLYPCVMIGDNYYYHPDKIVSKMPDAKLNEFRITRSELSEVINRHDNKRYWVNRNRIQSKTWDEFVAKMNQSNYDEMFRELNTPIFSVKSEYSRTVVTLNPILGVLKFQQVVDPVTTFQQIAMYLGNQLAKVNDPPSTITDEIMARKKGFDKWSFRTQSGDSKKVRRRRNRQDKRLRHSRTKEI